MASKVNMTFDCFSLRRLSVSSIIGKCIEATLKAEKKTEPQKTPANFKGSYQKRKEYGK